MNSSGKLVFQGTRAIFSDPQRKNCPARAIRSYEALAVSEVLAVIEQHPTAAILIAADVDPERAKAIQHQYPTMHLKPATVKEIVWELSHVRNGGPIYRA
jgi:hypothetical protein